MVFINKKIGNGFKIDSVNSSLDNEHYFNDHFKSIKTRWYFFSGTDTTGKSSYEIDFGFETGSLGCDTSFYDGNDYPIIRVSGTEPDWFKAVFGADPSFAATFDPLIIYDAEFSCKLSSSGVAFNFDDIDLTITGESLKPKGVLSDKADDEGNFSFVINYSTEFTNGVERTSPVFGFPLLTMHNNHASATYYFKNVKIEFFSFLTDDGVKFYRDVDNQNVPFQYTNTNVLKEIE